MAQRIVIDPVTRIEGHLRVEVEVENKMVVNAWTKGTMFRGIEQIIQGRDPRDAVFITERVCGVCMAAHGWTSATAIENASGADIPPVARLIRNLLAASLWLHDHVLHFYHLSALDYLDILAIKNYQGKDEKLLTVKEKILKLVEAGDTAPFTPRYNPDDYSVADPEVVTTVVSHYLDALKIQAKAKKMSAILGGKQPHQSSIVVGGVTGYPSVEQLQQFKHLLAQVAHFIKTIYVPDVVNLATGPLLPLAQSGFGEGPGNYLSYGGFTLDAQGEDKLFKAGFVRNNQMKRIESLDESKITEAVTSSWYKDSPPAHPWAGSTEVDLDKEKAYTFIKAPRYDGLPTEVGPLARMIISEHEPFFWLMEEYGIKPGAVARHLARAQEAVLICDAMFQWLRELEETLAQEKAAGQVNIHNTQAWEPPLAGKGAGLQEAPRGALGHWVEIADKKVKNYQMVVPTTWNISPRDDKGIRGPMEQALIGIPVNPNNPVNLVRVIRSFNPCLACAVHVVSPQGEKVYHILG